MAIRLLPLTFILLGCTEIQSQTGAYDPAAHFGVAGLEAGKPYLEIQNSSLKPGFTIQLIATLPRQSASSATILSAATICPHPNGDSVGTRCYAIEPRKTQAEFSLPAIAVIGSPVNSGYTFRSCLSSEGIHFTAWKNKPLVGKPGWHAYYHLDYNVEPSCTPSEVAND